MSSSKRRTTPRIRRVVTARPSAIHRDSTKPLHWRASLVWLQGQLADRVAGFFRSRGNQDGRFVAAWRERRPSPALLTASIFISSVTIAAIAAFAPLSSEISRPDVTTGNLSSPNGAVLGVQTEPSVRPSGARSPDELVDSFDFNLLRIGPLRDASPAIEHVIGDAEVVAFPSPFDRSLRFFGPGPDRFCLSSDRVDGGGTFTSMSVFMRTSPVTGSLELTLAPSRGTATAAQVALSALATLPPKHWYTIRVAWGLGTLGIDVSEAGRNALISLSQSSAVVPSSPIVGGVCIGASDLGSGEILIDNVRIGVAGAES
jgi:hypothetical protein